jgi:uncharacterized membrane protein (DUF373 family)
MVAESNSPARTWIARTFTAVEDIMYIGLGILLALCAGALLVSAIGGAANSLMAGTFVRDTTRLLDRMLLILLIVELLYTVQVSFREHTLMPEPFLLVGLIAAIRRVLLLTAEFGHPGSPGTPGLELLLWELGVLTALILSLALSLALLRKRGRPAAAERA